jgi:hypothetical protein
MVHPLVSHRIFAVFIGESIGLFGQRFGSGTWFSLLFGTGEPLPGLLTLFSRMNFHNCRILVVIFL